MKNFFVLTLLGFLLGCAGKKVSDTTDARAKLQEKYNGWIGTARKADFVQEFGNPNWCRPDENGSESCRFYKKLKTKWVGETKEDKKSYETFDEVIVEFAPTGLLKKVEVNSQR